MFQIKLDNLNCNGYVTITSHDVSGARKDRSIMGSNWEIADDKMAYAVVDDRVGLLSELEETYDVDASDYYEPEV